MVVRRGRFAGHPLALGDGMLDPALVATFVHGRRAVSQDCMRQRPDSQSPREQQEPQRSRPQAALTLGGGGEGHHVSGSVQGALDYASRCLADATETSFALGRRPSAQLPRTVASEMERKGQGRWADARRVAAAVAMALWLFTPLASAHLTRVSTSDWSLGEGTASAELQFFEGDFVGLIPAGLSDADAEARVLALVAETTFVRSGDRPCQLGSHAISAKGDAFLVKAVWRCPAAGARWSVRLGVLELLPAGQTHLARVSVGGEVVERIARSATPAFEVDVNPTVWAAAWRFLRLGVEHIFTGYDHIAFLLALLLLGGRFLDLVKIVTSFTIAHSVTLALAALGILNPPSRWVEALIAASIVAVAGENLWVLRTTKDASARVATALQHRWRITFAFGLVHGFGFAAALQELKLPRSALVAGLVSFNLGVEVGQVAIVALAFPLLSWLRSLRGFQPWGPRLLSGAIAAFGLLLLIQRVRGG
jgi:HupE / UreJ protein